MNPDQQDAPQEQVSLADLIVDLNFVPAWAREDHKAPSTSGEPADGRGERPPRESRSHRPRRPGTRPGGPFERKGAGAAHERQDSAREAVAEERELAPVRVRFLPDRTALGIVARDLHVSKRAVPLPRLASILFNGQTSCLVKLEMEERKAGDAAKWFPHLFECKVCHQVFRDYAGAFAHVVSAHVELHFRREEREGEPPPGVFSCVGRCRLSGELLGPPNHHFYHERLMNLYRRRFSHIPLDEYRQQIEMVRDPETIERWRQEARKQEVFFALDPRDGSGELSRRDAERVFGERYARGLIRETKRVLIPRRVAMALEDSVLSKIVQHYAAEEAQRPFSMMLALRAAFHHMGFHTFRARGQFFVTAVEPRPLDPAHAVGPVAEILAFLQSHPGCKRHDVVAQLRPNAPMESPEVLELSRHLSWLVEKGHVIEFFDGTLAVPHSASSFRGERRLGDNRGRP